MLKFLLLELKRELIQGIIIACIIHKVRLDNQNNFFRIFFLKKARKWVCELLKYSLCGTLLEAWACTHAEHVLACLFSGV